VSSECVALNLYFAIYSVVNIQINIDNEALSFSLQWWCRGENDYIQHITSLLIQHHRGIKHAKEQPRNV
jgi:hypothetical protein